MPLKQCLALEVDLPWKLKTFKFQGISLAQATSMALQLILYFFFLKRIPKLYKLQALLNWVCSCLAHSKYLVNVSFYYLHLILRAVLYGIFIFNFVYVYFLVFKLPQEI